MIDALLKRIENEMADCAQQALARPAERDAFEYGRMAGMYAGLNRVREIVLLMSDEADQRDI